MWTLGCNDNMKHNVLHRLRKVKSVMDMKFTHQLYIYILRKFTTVYVQSLLAMETNSEFFWMAYFLVKVCLHIYIYTHVYMYVNIYIYIIIYIQSCMEYIGFLCVYIHTLYAYTYIYIYTSW